MSDGPRVTELIILRCPGGFVGEVVNGRFLRVVCRQRKCQSGGRCTGHTFDLMNGALVMEKDSFQGQPQPGELPGEE